ncbi:hypothetical protein [Congregicoccus parvus]|uniref:hypothetical protein n=1 Tax=Congregicoccus parvus TaxID=3081749 RepID=UPI003FA598ED
MHSIETTIPCRSASDPASDTEFKPERAPMPASWLCLTGAVLFALLFVLTFVAGAAAAP